MQRNYVTIRPLNREDSDDPLDRDIDFGASPQPRAPHALDLDVEPPSRRWPIVAMFAAFVILAALSVGFFLRSPRPTSAPQKDTAVDETIVDLPGPAPVAPVPVAPAPVTPARNASAPNASASAPTAPIATADKPNAPVAPNSGRLLIRSTPADADVFVDGKLRGKTPLALRELALGSYTIRVARDGYVAEERTVRLTAERPATSTTIDLRASESARPAFAASAASAGKPQRTGLGVLNVRSRPAGARVYVNGRLAGKTPIAIPSLPAGPATVRIEMDGYRLWTTRVNVKAGEQTPVAASLERP